MKPNRRLALRREALSELSREELLLAVAGDAPETTPVTDCLSLKARCSWSCPA